MSISTTNKNNSDRHVWEFQKGAAYSRIYNYQCNILNIYVSACAEGQLPSNINDLKEVYKDIDTDCYKTLNNGTKLIAKREDRVVVKQLVFRFFEEGPLTGSKDGAKYLNPERFILKTESTWEPVWSSCCTNFFLCHGGKSS